MTLSKKMKQFNLTDAALHFLISWYDGDEDATEMLSDLREQNFAYIRELKAKEEFPVPQSIREARKEALDNLIDAYLRDRPALTKFVANYKSGQDRSPHNLVKRHNFYPNDKVNPAPEVAALFDYLDLGWSFNDGNEIVILEYFSHSWEYLSEIGHCDIDWGNPAWGEGQYDPGNQIEDLQPIAQRTYLIFIFPLPENERDAADAFNRGFPGPFILEFRKSVKREIGQTVYNCVLADNKARADQNNS